MPVPSMDQAPGAASGRVREIEEGGVHAAGHRAAVLHQGDRDRDHGESVDEVRGAVERVDDPVAAGPGGTAVFFSQHRDLGRSRGQVGADRPFAGDVDLGHVVAGEALSRGRAPLPGGPGSPPPRSVRPPPRWPSSGSASHGGVP